MIEVGRLLGDSVLLQARITDAMNAAKAAGDIEGYGILAGAEPADRQRLQYPSRPAFGSRNCQRRMTSGQHPQPDLCTRRRAPRAAGRPAARRSLPRHRARG